MKKEQTTIALKKKTVEKLKSLGRKGETYDEVIQSLLRRLAAIDAAGGDGYGKESRHG